MSFHYDLTVDSSDDDQVDLATWKGGEEDASNRRRRRSSSESAFGAYPKDIFAHRTANSRMQRANALTAGDGAADDDYEAALATMDALAQDIFMEQNSASSGGGEDNSSVHMLSAADGTASVNQRQRQLNLSSSAISSPEPATGLRHIVAPAGKLVPVLPVGHINLDEYEDMSRGYSVVKAVLRVLRRVQRQVFYEVEFEDGHMDEVSSDQLLQYEKGESALQAFNSGRESESESESDARPKMPSLRTTRRVNQNAGFVNTVEAVPLSEDDEDPKSDSESEPGSQIMSLKRKLAARQEVYVSSDSEADTSDGTESGDSRPRRRLRTEAPRRNLRTSTRPISILDESDDDMPFLTSDLPRVDRKRSSRKLTGRGLSDDDNSGGPKAGDRQSGRTTRHRGGMQEVGEDDIYLSDSNRESRTPPRPKASGAREAFKILPRNDDFRMRHNQECDTCGQGGNFAPLIYCEGCTFAYHKSCLGHRTSRDHLVTKVGDGDFVLQCRRCIAFAQNKDRTAPDQGKCADCHEHGNACRPFRPRKTPAQEQKERDENGGEDPIYGIDPSRLKRSTNVLFRCVKCFRSFHFEHLPSRSDIVDMESEVDAEQRFREYSRDWRCKECLDMPAKPSGLIAWKPVDEDSYDGIVAVDKINEDEKAYLVKWDGMSYFRASWMPGAWVWGVAPVAMRKAFGKREDAQYPKMRTEDAIPEDFLRTDIVLDIKFTSIVDIGTEEIDKARIREVEKALIKYKGLGYEDAVWEAPPGPEDGDRWTDFVIAYNDWVLGRYVRQPKPNSLRSRLEKMRLQDFATLEKEKQPDNLDGGQLMNYQVDGLNWLYYKWYTQKNAILADEMGLGKTIQVIGFLATLVQDWSCFPFLIVVPNSTCPNWRREFKRWAPSLRVVSYFGSRESRDLSYRYELFPEHSRELRCHVVVTSYEAASDENSRKFLRGVNWQGLIVDEGQRLKNDKNLLYASLRALRTPCRILLTGTPLQNNQRELFNLLHFLDETFDAARLEEEYSDTQLDSAKITELHEMIRPFFLRRTKAQVLTFLPPMAQIIVPISMTLVQKKLYRTILAKNPELMKAIFAAGQSVGKTERSSLNNILMQLRKCLCHPFVYNKSIEERNVDFHASHRNLVDASSKLKLLELLLPKLKERGHRVLIFSQFLDMLDIVEDFLDGLEMRYQRLDGTIGALHKQKRIDEFNAPDSPLFAFLLSTRSGGVGINLATADTVIILDPDFNPHQDIQALSRAHRIGQSKKVLCFQLVTRASAEERIMQIGRKKLALDHVLIQEMDADEENEGNLVSVLRHGASELFEDSGEQDIQYDAAGVERLLDRSHFENTRTGEDSSAEAQFSCARVWANDRGTLEDEIGENAADEAPDPGVWANILKERERAAAEEAAAKAEDFGRGRRARGTVDYAGDQILDGAEGLELTPIKNKKPRNSEDSDTDFQADGSDGDDDIEAGEEDADEHIDELLESSGIPHTKRATGRKPDGPPAFRRHNLSSQPYTIDGVHHAPHESLPQPAQAYAPPPGLNCLACKTFHPVGSCPIKMAGVEHCNLCGMAHFGSGRVCPHIQSETQVRAMMEALRHSNESEHLVVEARKYLRGVKGSLVQLKKQREIKARIQRETEALEAYQRARGPIWLGN